MEIREKIMADMKLAMREKDTLRLETIRFLQAAIKNREIDLRPQAITNDEVMAVIKKMVKQRKESIDQYQQAGRQDLVDKEQAELKVIEGYLPAQMTREQIESLVKETIAELKPASIKDMGPVMKAVIAKSQGTADNKIVSELIKAQLGGA